MANVKMQETMETVERFIISQMSTQSFGNLTAEDYYILDSMENQEEYEVFPKPCDECNHPHMLVTGYNDNTDEYSITCPKCHDTYDAHYMHYDNVMEAAYDEDYAEETTTQVYIKPYQPQEIIVIGKPMFTQLFVKDGYKFTFLESGEVANYNFNKDTECWVLTYELTTKELHTIMKNNNLPKNINVLKQFSNVQPLLD